MKEQDTRGLSVLAVGIIALLIGLALGGTLVLVLVKTLVRPKCPENTLLDAKSNVCVVNCPSGFKWESEYLNCVTDVTIEQILTDPSSSYDGRQVRIHGFLTLVSVTDLSFFLGLKKEYTFVLANDTSGPKSAAWILVHWTTSDVPSDITDAFFVQGQVEVIGTVHYAETGEQRGNVYYYSINPEISVDRVTVVTG